MSKIMRIKFTKLGDMKYISHLDVQRLFQRVFRRAEVRLSYSQGFNPHPKMSYGNALALGVESHGEYVDIEIEDDISPELLVEKINNQLPEGMDFIKCVEIQTGVKSLAGNIEYGNYDFVIENVDNFTKSEVSDKIDKILSLDMLNVTKKNKKGKLVEMDIIPMIKSLEVKSVEDDKITINSIISTGSIKNLNTNVFLPKLIELLDVSIDPLEVDVIRNDLYFVEQGELVSPI
ncbi:TIGR03936 family radical SAM-associated protein [Peptostreptococcus porci]|uniref:TIGR03936 family radical SAM-associated protein n=1 Tax=Peptostreptococcus porci TaxID=2652282 RepID=UPI002A91D1D9|nr:TIGR03936 family radical SAM-associated protein [Peptostreptococcus porci]MDY5437058.1 TIGR03936 family radical SAM-associated protein [Peptostreptococcus porci]MDY6231904.1 TIGR03936 family radical SAM-associated protein [Peptostreptococcus porci]